MRTAATLLALASLAGCGTSPTTSGPDAGTDVPALADSGADHSVPDAGNTDAGNTDAGSTDAGNTDAGSTDAGSTDAGSTDAGSVATPTLPPENGELDYQLGGAYPPPVGVGIVSRDRTDSPASGIYNVCYVNGFQIQPGEEDAWMRDHPALILRDGSGQPVIDADWNEVLIDVSTPAKRAELAAVVGAWIDGCASAGFNAVEVDNLDSYTRSGGLLSADDAVATIRLFADRAHAAALAIAQKNATELVVRRAEMGTDFAVAEECNHYAECDAYTAGYGLHVLMIEYTRADFSAGCAAYSGYSIVLRDRNLVPAGTTGYVYDGC